MKKGEIFTFTASNGVEVTAVVIDYLGNSHEQVIYGEYWEHKYLCYAQNRLFYHIEEIQIDSVIDDDFTPSCEEDYDYDYAMLYHSHQVRTTNSSQETLVDYCILPDYDELLKIHKTP